MMRRSECVSVLIGFAGVDCGCMCLDLALCARVGKFC